eukprot:TRINITY_DN2806_c0_g1_i4.p1 TRINITY_DN2806_c0_g1~~TRINITY_DN2806_c0_g1_i4.p1  ORF type:complete len:120 (-),score=12.82 TRINITY_DN2806_c0_g1_i4:35-394(-)
MQVVSLKPDYRLGCLKATFILRYNKFVPNTWALESDNHRGFFVRANGANLSLQREEDNVTFRSQASFFCRKFDSREITPVGGWTSRCRCRMCHRGRCYRHHVNRSFGILELRENSVGVQ